VPIYDLVQSVNVFALPFQFFSFCLVFNLYNVCVPVENGYLLSKHCILGVNVTIMGLCIPKLLGKHPHLLVCTFSFAFDGFV
jgi:hypothetical protein